MIDGDENLTFCFFDIEVDGPTPGENSMLGFGCVACDASGEVVGTHSVNLNTLDGAQADPGTEAWWTQRPEVWAALRADCQPPATAMHALVAWLDGLGGSLVFAAHPLLFDGPWIDWYLRRFTGRLVFSGPFAASGLFVGAGVDIPSYVQAAFGMSYFKRRPDYPSHWLGDVEHTHLPIDDAHGHAHLYFFARRAVASTAWR